MPRIQLVVFDMAGTTVQDHHEVEDCIYRAAQASGLIVSRDRVHDMNGLQKRRIFELLWADVLPVDHPEFAARVDHSYATFRQILEEHYRTAPVLPAEGAEEVIQWLRAGGVKVALNTGFYRKVANIILGRLGWDKGLDERYRGSLDAFIDLSVTPTETGERGRPHPDMILHAMKELGVQDPKKVIKVGDVPVDIQEGRNAGCLLSLGVTNGVGSREELEAEAPDGLLKTIGELKFFLEERGLV
jgi:phosphonatase-like hydrolase